MRQSVEQKPSRRKLNTNEAAYFIGAVSEPPIAAVRSCPQSRDHDVLPTTSHLEIDAVSSNAGVSPPSIDQEIAKPSAWTIPIPAGSFTTHMAWHHPLLAKPPRSDRSHRPQACLCQLRNKIRKCRGRVPMQALLAALTRHQLNQ